MFCLVLLRKLQEKLCYLCLCVCVRAPFSAISFDKKMESGGGGMEGRGEKQEETKQTRDMTDTKERGNNGGNEKIPYCLQL